NNRTIIRNYDRARFGFVYRPVYAVRSPVFVSWYDPYWYGPSGVWIHHPFRFTWGWDDYGWYRWHRHYWNCYEVYPTPSYWVTDWMIAGYVADRYAVSASIEQAREEARLAREDAERAREAAGKAREDAEIAEAKAADQSPAGMLTEGDLLKLEPGQEAILKEANENTFVTMRVMTSKGDEGEAKAGTLVSVTLKSLQDFDSEFRAKLDLGLAEADKNK